MKKGCEHCEVRDLGVFCDLKAAALQQINDLKVEQVYAKGQTLFYAGNNPTGLFCVREGLVKLESVSGDGHGHLLRILGPGDLVGYRSLFSDEPYDASAVAQEDVKICFIPKQVIFGLIRSEPDLALALLSRLSSEIKDSEDRMCKATDQSASERVAEALIFLKDHFGGQNWTRREIGEWAGTTPETVMRTLAVFEDEGLIRTQGRKIEVLDRAKLVAKTGI
jgi:CRP-like cAMP-binding protein